MKLIKIKNKRLLDANPVVALMIVNDANFVDMPTRFTVISSKPSL